MIDYGVPKPEEEIEVVPMEEMFAAYCRMDPVSYAKGVKLIPLSQSDKWLISARLLDMHTLTTTETGTHFFKFKKRALSYTEYLEYLEDLAKAKNLDLNNMMYHMQRSGKPIHPRDIKKN
ncbi:TPPP family protein CG45057-like [Cephus cinctus]|uniref:TPPP family protein CG45057-like n=1 Tax=Cephus cinctus TaxID=211228 RepID=A0AAJ7RMI4_CEPCN|nr:TPPP family protein CG45057-like [Cephus cinctus]